eukprot:CAMPEP_0179434710 /NCGR_PEP_ID=MMETSP0799-20121207/18976_1 /TAXON_ID=46947 /ORGANISM="Geminigera cryophila, Strain CCMP2564" /LENGTH=105 /DNA_ID=CAMNT_0021213665 /DNA_START=22 /DNA_END=339 /DNA_ORIENTATION=+
MSSQTTASSSILRRAALLLALIGAAAAAVTDSSGRASLRDRTRTPSPSPSHDSLLPTSPGVSPLHGLRHLENQMSTSGRDNQWEFKLTADDFPSAVDRQALRVHV